MSLWGAVSDERSGLYNGLFHWEDCCFVSGAPVITLDKEGASLEAI
jgi:hypothetical protein